MITCVPIILKCGACFRALGSIRALDNYVSAISYLKLLQYLSNY